MSDSPGPYERGCVDEPSEGVEEGQNRGDSEGVTPGGTDETNLHVWEVEL